MQKLKLKDRQIVNILDGSKENYYQIVLSEINEFATLYNKLTEDNLSEFKIYTDDDVLNAVYSDKAVAKIYPGTVTLDSVETLVAILELKPADVVGKNIKDLQVSQNLQNIALMELAAKVDGGV